MPKLRCLSCARGRAVWIPALGLAALAGIACEAGAWRDPAEPRPEARSASARLTRVRVAYPRGDCTTGEIEVEVFREGDWGLHPEHSIVAPDSVHWENEEEVLSLRVRCVDSTGRRPPSKWITGVRVEGGSDAAEPDPL